MGLYTKQVVQVRNGNKVVYAVIDLETQETVGTFSTQAQAAGVAQGLEYKAQKQKAAEGDPRVNMRPSLANSQTQSLPAWQVPAEQEETGGTGVRESPVAPVAPAAPVTTGLSRTPVSYQPGNVPLPPQIMPPIKLATPSDYELAGGTRWEPTLAAMPEEWNPAPQQPAKTMPFADWQKEMQALAATHNYSPEQEKQPEIVAQPAQSLAKKHSAENGKNVVVPEVKRQSAVTDLLTDDEYQKLVNEE